MDTATEALTQADRFLDDVLAGLSAPRKSLPCRWLYDHRGSELFEAITRLPEYYPTRTELAILDEHLAEIARFVGHGAPLLEYGAGSARKTERLLAAAQPSLYIPVDISADYLAETAVRLQSRFPGTAVLPVVADFMAPFALPEGLPPQRTVFFPGSTVGNLADAEIDALLERMRGHAGPGGRALIGIDLVKPLAVLLPAYADAAGITAEFNRNLLARANRELGADFDIAAFNHEARWNATASAVEMHLVSTRMQRVRIAGRSFYFREGETIHTETSRKFELGAFAARAAAAGWATDCSWTDPHRWFALVGLSNGAQAPGRSPR
jgi:dimethylhistidine N-methyltransferase